MIALERGRATVSSAPLFASLERDIVKHPSTSPSDVCRPLRDAPAQSMPNAPVPLSIDAVCQPFVPRNWRRTLTPDALTYSRRPLCVACAASVARRAEEH